MDLNRISTVVRPRSPWQALDLGILMARQWFAPLLAGWLAVTLPVFVILQWAFNDIGLLPILIFWWLLPLWEKIQLVYLGHKLFGEHLTLKQQLNIWRSAMWRNGIAAITLRRFNPQRTYSLPITQLEGLKGKRRRQRLALFNGPNQQAAVWLSVVGLLMTGALIAAAWLLLYFLMPQGSAWEQALSRELWALPQLFNGLAYVSITLISPFVMAGAFSLYLNQRTQIEGWDIEIVFRNLSQRQQKPANRSVITSILLAAMLFGSLGLPTPVAAEQAQVEAQVAVPPSQDQTDAKARAVKVLSEDKYGKKVTEAKGYFEFRFKNKDKEPEKKPEKESSDDESLDNLVSVADTVLSFVAGSFELLLSAIFVGLLLIVAYHYRGWLAKNIHHTFARKDQEQELGSAFSMPIDKKSLPAQPHEEARSLYQQGRPREALSLLYRASLYHLVTQQHLNVHDSFTEGECVAQVQRSAPAATADYFRTLTRHWQALAYAAMIPNDNVMETLLQQWAEQFGAAHGN